MWCWRSVSWRLPIEIFLWLTKSLGGNVVGVPVPVTVQMKDQYGNDRPDTQWDHIGLIAEHNVTMIWGVP